MLRSLAAITAVVAAGLVTLLAGAPAAADPWAACGPHSLEEKTVRVFPRTPSAAGPVGDSSVLQCGNRYYGLRRVEARWARPAPGDWRAAADTAIAHTLVSGVVPVLDARSGNHTYATPQAEVVVGPHGVIIDARPATATAPPGR